VQHSDFTSNVEAAHPRNKYSSTSTQLKITVNNGSPLRLQPQSHCHISDNMTQQPQLQSSTKYRNHYKVSEERRRHRLPMDSTDFGSLHRFRNSVNATDDKILVDAQ